MVSEVMKKFQLGLWGRASPPLSNHLVRAEASTSLRARIVSVCSLVHVSVCLLVISAHLSHLTS